MVTNRPACIPIADLSGSRLRFGSKRMVIPLKFGRSHYRMTPPTPIDQ